MAKDEKKTTAPFGLNIGSGGDILPYVKLDGKDGTVSRSTYDGSERGTETIEDFVALFDFDTVQVGWMRFDSERPDMRLVAYGDPLPDRPGEDYKQGIKMLVMLPDELGIHELATTATGVIGALFDLFEAASAAPESEEDQIPAVKLLDWKRDKMKKGTRAIPQFAIIGWKERPEALRVQGAAKRPKTPDRGFAPLQPPPVPPKHERGRADLDSFG